MNYCEPMIAGVLSVLMMIIIALMYRGNYKLGKENTRLIGENGDQARVNRRLISDGDRLFADNLHLKEMLKMYEGKETAHFKMVEKLIQDHADLVTLRSLWVVMETMETAIIGPIDIQESRVEKVLRNIKNDIKFVLDGRPDPERKVVVSTDVSTAEEDDLSGEENPKP